MRRGAGSSCWAIIAATAGNWTEMSALDHIATRIAPKFGVSAEVIAKRLRVEKLWSPTIS